MPGRPGDSDGGERVGDEHLLDVALGDHVAHRGAPVTGDDDPAGEGQRDDRGAVRHVQARRARGRGVPTEVDPLGHPAGEQVRGRGREVVRERGAAGRHARAEHAGVRQPGLGERHVPLDLRQRGWVRVVRARPPRSRGPDGGRDRGRTSNRRVRWVFPGLVSPEVEATRRPSGRRRGRSLRRSPRARRRSRRGSCRRPPRASQRGDRCQQPAAMANRRDTQSDQIIGGKLWQHSGIDVVLTERRRVSLETELMQPTCNVDCHPGTIHPGKPAPTICRL